MSFTSGLIKTAINCTPDFMMQWVANFILKGIAEISSFNFDLDTRMVYILLTLNGETEAIEVWIDGFAISQEYGVTYLMLNEGRSNKPWLNAIFAKITGKRWKIPALPQFQTYIDLAADVFKPVANEQEEVETDV
jgi:hypothetical protein